MKKLLHSPEFLSRNRRNEKDFTRKRSLPFPTLVLFLGNFLKSSIQSELNWFFKALKKKELPEKEVTDSAFIQARAKLKFQAFIELNRHQVDYFYQHFSPKKWKDYRLVGVDGSTIRLPYSKELSDHFGIQIAGRGKHCPIGRASQLFDPLNKITIDAAIDPISVDERSQLASMLEQLGPKDIVILDRGYPAFWLFALLISKKIPFVSRVTVSTWKAAKELIQAKCDETIAVIKANDQAKKLCKAHGLSTSPIQLRFIRINLPSGEPEVLITSFLDTAAFPHSDFGYLYRQRWGIETDFNFLKCKLEVERFTGLSVISVMQDFHAKVFSKNLALILAFQLNEKVKMEDRSRMYTYQINLTQVFSTMKDTIVLLLLRVNPQRLLKGLLDIFFNDLTPIRPGRGFPRNHRGPRRYPNTYKPIR